MAWASLTTSSTTRMRIPHCLLGMQSDAAFPESWHSHQPIRVPADILPGVTMALRGPEREARVGDFWQSVFGGFAAVLWIGVAVLVVIGYRRPRAAGHPGWAAIIPSTTCTSS